MSLLLLQEKSAAACLGASCGRCLETLTGANGDFALSPVVGHRNGEVMIAIMPLREDVKTDGDA